MLRRPPTARQEARGAGASLVFQLEVLERRGIPEAPSSSTRATEKRERRRSQDVSMAPTLTGEGRGRATFIGRRRDHAPHARTLRLLEHHQARRLLVARRAAAR